MPDQPALTREERLALKLRDNLRRRKAQARAMGTDEANNAPHDSPETLPKPPPSR